MRTRLLIAVLAAGTSALGAQQRPRDGTPELRPFAGALVPVGAQRDDFKTATMAGLQTAIEFRDKLHVLASLAWTHGHNRFFTKDRTDIWQYDLGAEFNLIRSLTEEWRVRPFFGAGAGGRTYDYRVAGVENKSCLAGYGALGSELETGSLAFRVEARDYLSCFESPLTGKKKTRSDLGISVGLAYHIR